jgi:Cu(I)/Ag(I) efflux system membrane protein CusA/SilA
MPRSTWCTTHEHIDDLLAARKIVLPKGVTYQFTGTYEKQIHAAKRLAIIIPIALMHHPCSSSTSSSRASPPRSSTSRVCFVAFAGGFILMWLYGQDWFLNFEIAGVNMRTLFGLGKSTSAWPYGWASLPSSVSPPTTGAHGYQIHQTFLEDKHQ